MKKQVLETALSAEQENLCRFRSGNFSMRDRVSGYICITPSGIDRREILSDDIVVIDMKAHIIETKRNLKPSSELMMHISAYENREDIDAVVHTHSRFATAFAVLNKKIPAVVYELFNLKCKAGYIPVAPYGRPGTMELAISIIESLKIADVLLLQGHGVLAVADNLKEALLKSAYTEDLAQIYYLALTANKFIEPNVFSTGELDSWRYPNQITSDNQ